MLLGGHTATNNPINTIASNIGKTCGYIPPEERGPSNIHSSTIIPSIIKAATALRLTPCRVKEPYSDYSFIFSLSAFLSLA